MSHRERVVRALRRQDPDRVPTCARFTPPMMRTFNEKVRAGIPHEHLGDMSIGSGFIHEVRPSYLTPDDYFDWDVRHVAFRSPEPDPTLRGYHGELPPGARLNEWGVAYAKGSTLHYTTRVGPLRHMTDPEELDAFPFPDPMAPSLQEALNREVAAIHEDGYGAAGFLQQTLFELAWEMRGLDTLLMDFVVNKLFAERLLDRIADIRCAMAARYAAAGVDILRLGDDLATQHSLFMSREMAWEFIFPRLKRIIDAAKEVNPDIIIFFHSDGSVTPLIEDFITIGVEVLNPLQPECVDVGRVKDEYGDRLSFWGGIGIQTTMPFGSPEDVRVAVRDLIRTVGQGGGLFAAPTHALQPDVSWENVVAFFEAVDEYGWY